MGAASARLTIETPMRRSPSSLVGIQGFRRAQKRDAAAGKNALFDRRARRVQRVFDASLLLLHLDLGRRADFDDGDAARELREALLELLTVVVGGGRLDLRCGFAAMRPAMSRRSCRRLR
jgi:hypothetical protein